MTDRKLLELAAAAGGLSPDLFTWDEQLECIKYQFKSDITYGHLWNPLTDDGDALRLAVKLNMDFTLSGKHAAVAQSGETRAQEYCNGNPYSATRRAIVRVAAELGAAA